MLKALASQLELLNDNDFMPTSSKAHSVNLEKTKTINDDDDNNLNEDMEDYFGVWIEDHANSLDTPDSNKTSQDKGKKQKD